MNNTDVESFLSDASIKHFRRILGQEMVPSPSTVAVMAPLDVDSFEGRLNCLASEFLDNIMAKVRIHVEHCCSMRIQPVDVNWALEQFAKEYIRGPSLYVCVDTAMDGSDEQEYTLSESDRQNSMDEDMNWEADESDSDEEDYDYGVPTKPCPHHSQTQIFNSVFPPFCGTEVFSGTHECQVIQFLTTMTHCDDSEKIIMDAMLRYITVRSLKDK